MSAVGASAVRATAERAGRSGYDDDGIRAAVTQQRDTAAHQRLAAELDHGLGPAKPASLASSEKYSSHVP